MQRKASKLVLISAGAALAWFLDPVSGADRRRQVTEQLSGLGGGRDPVGDPTGGAPPPLSAVPTPPPPARPDDAALLQAVEAASDGAKVVGTPAAEEDPDQSRASLRTTW